ncbi:MAG: hypothetical protein V4507_10715 [Verrucomicrobiota bacterium]
MSVAEILSEIEKLSSQEQDELLGVLRPKILMEEDEFDKTLEACAREGVFDKLRNEALEEIAQGKFKCR